MAEQEDLERRVAHLERQVEMLIRVADGEHKVLEGMVALVEDIDGFLNGPASPRGPDWEAFFAKVFAIGKTPPRPAVKCRLPRS